MTSSKKGAASTHLHGKLRKAAYGLATTTVIIPASWYCFWQMWGMFSLLSFFARFPDLLIARHQGRVIFALGLRPVLTPRFFIYHLMGLAFISLSFLILARHVLKAKRG